MFQLVCKFYNYLFSSNCLVVILYVEAILKYNFAIKIFEHKSTLKGRWPREMIIVAQFNFLV